MEHKQKLKREAQAIYNTLSFKQVLKKQYFNNFYYGNRGPVNTTSVSIVSVYEKNNNLI